MLKRQVLKLFILSETGQLGCLHVLWAMPHPLILTTIPRGFQLEVFIQADCHPYHPTNSVKALNTREHNQHPTMNAK